VAAGSSVPITEEEWFSPVNYLWLISAAEKLPIARTKAGRRKFRLLSCACGRLVWHHFQDEMHRELLELAERVAEDAATMEELQAAYREMRKVKEAQRGLRGIVGELVRGATEKQASRGVRRAMSMASYLMAVDALPESRTPEQLNAQAEIEELTLCDLLRDAFGNPFRPAAFDARWRTPAVLSLAQAIYGGRSFADLPILADALIDAGCDSEDLLAHCRADGPHARGCWALDLVLGRN
jgi:hypothetical protein